MSLDEMLLRSELRREKAVPGEVERLIETVGRRLQDAAHGEIHPETRLEQAYHAILGCSLVALRAHDLRTTDRPGHHVVALESLADTLGLPLDRIDYFQTLRALRNKDLYTGGTHPRSVGACLRRRKANVAHKVRRYRNIVPVSSRLEGRQCPAFSRGVRALQEG